MAVSGNIFITIEEILSKVSEEDLFKYYTKGLLPDTLSNSPLRIDKDPSFIYGKKWGRWIYKDFANNESGNIFNFIQKLYSCTFKESLQIINNDFNIVNLKVKYSPILINNKKNFSKKKRKIIKIRTDKWNSFYLKYWYEYGISKNTLKYFNVFPVTHYWLIIEKETLFFKTYLAYAYKIFNTVKILNLVKNSLKWVSNCKNDDWQGLEQFLNSDSINTDFIIITKSLKDVMVLYECGFNSISPQSEVPKFSKIILNFLLKFKKVYILYDNDKPGIEAANKLKNLYNFNLIFVPEGKDISGYSKLYGVQKTKDLIFKLVYNE